MKILVTGKGTSGSWQIRGIQMGAAIGATVKPNATLADMREHDVVVLVKRPTPDLLDSLQRSGRPFVHDIVDAWPQPAGNEWPEVQCKTWFVDYCGHIGAHAVICATKAMERDCTHPVKTTIYHHANPAYSAMAAPAKTNLVGYEGAVHYLGRYRAAIFDECAARGWLFDDRRMIGAPHIAIALRDTAGYATRNWKSNVKLANAQALVIPALCSPEAGYQETSTGGVLWINEPADLREAFDKLADPEHYAKVCAAVDKPPTLAECAAQYLAFLERVCADR